ncbi:MAG: type II/IV secretion system protein [Phycisphaerae bacterium]|nr:type II/IV secretion system protein [Phycisphaerae bacterium]
MEQEPENTDIGLARLDTFGTDLLSKSDGNLDELWSPQPAGAGPVSGPEAALLSNGEITHDQLELAHATQKDNPHLSVLDALVRGNAITEERSVSAAADYFKLPYRRITVDDVNEEAFMMLPVNYLRSKVVLPLDWHDEAIIIAISNPSDIFLMDDFRRRLNVPVELVVSPPADIRKTIEDLSAGPGQQVDDIVADFDDDTVALIDSDDEEQQDLEQIAGESPVIRYVNYVISTAVREGASDIHIEPGEKRLRVRFRMDGILFEQTAPPVAMHAAILSRLKIMANLDIAERRLPQDGRIRVTVKRRSIDLRVSTLPTVHGEKCVIRILDNRSISVGLENLGFSQEILANFKNQILQPHGVILVTGPTGSGKSTTLYSALQIMDAAKLNISTVEDPVEYELSSITQVHVHDAIGMTFSAALRSLLRQDPDVVMIGEIRDSETARIAVQAALTGHLVLSTLHTNDAPSSITRLINIGVEPFLISAALNGILAQRLVRRICPNCKEEIVSASQREIDYVAKEGIENVQLFHGAGCERCRHTGYKGRVAIYELLELGDEMRALIHTNPSVNEVRKLAVKTGMKTLKIDGLEKVTQGLTTVEEVMRVTET